MTQIPAGQDETNVDAIDAKATDQQERATTSRHSRREVVAAATGAGGLALTGHLWFPADASARQATPAVPLDVPAPPGLTTGVDYFPPLVEGGPEAYLRLPTVFQSVPEPPGQGGTVRVLHVAYAAVPPPRESNPYWQEMERRLNVTWDVELVPPSAYPDRVATTIAGGDFPDLMLLDGGFLPSIGDLIQQGAFTDLTDYLTGDALQEYPNLAAFPEQIWRNAQFNGRIYQVPRPRTVADSQLVFRFDYLDRLGLASPTNSAEFTQVLQAMTQNDPNGNGQADTWGMGSQGNPPGLNNNFFGRMFRTPNTWRLNPDGTLTHQWSTDEFRQGLSYGRELFAAGIYHPDALTMTNPQAKDAIIAGAIGATDDGQVGMWGPNGLRDRAKELNPEANLGALIPFGHDGGPGVYTKTIGFFAGAYIPSAVGQDAERLRELLRVMNFLAAPLGSEEQRLRVYGIEGLHHTLNAEGAPILTEEGRTQIVDIFGIGNQPYAYYLPDNPQDGLYGQQLISDSIRIGIDNPVWGLYSPTEAEEGAVLADGIGDMLASVIAGREPLEAWDQRISEWQERGGDRIRGEFEEALASR